MSSTTLATNAAVTTAAARLLYLIHGKNSPGTQEEAAIARDLGMRQSTHTCEAIELHLRSP